MLWLGQSASVLGDALVVVAIGVYVTRRTGDVGTVGLVLTSYALPLVAFILFGGVIADRFPRRLVMITTDVVRCLLHATLAAVIAAGVVQTWQMVLIGVGYGTAEAFFRPAYTGLVPQTVPENEIQPAQALGSLSAQLAQFASPALATALIFGVGAAAVFALDAATFLVSAALLLRVRPRARGIEPTQATLLMDLREGWRAVRERAWVWANILAFSVAVLTALAPYFVLGAGVAHDSYGSSAVYGLATAAWGIGTVVGAIVGGRWRPRHPLRAGLTACLTWPAGVLTFGLGPARPVLLVAMAGAGIGLGLFIVWWETALAERIPPHLLSRVSAWDWMGSLALLPLGYLVAGSVAGAIGDRTVLVGGGAIGIVAIAMALLPRETRRLQRLERADEASGPALPAGSRPEPIPVP